MAGETIKIVPEEGDLVMDLDQAMAEGMQKFEGELKEAACFFLPAASHSGLDPASSLTLQPRFGYNWSSGTGGILSG